MRLPYISNPPTNLDSAGQDIVRQILRRRGKSGLLELDLTLLHSPAIACGWHAFFGAIYSGSIIQTDLLEIAICRVALLNRARYQFEGHAAMLQKCEGFDSEKMKTVATVQPADQGFLSFGQWVLLRYADAMMRDITVDRAIFSDLQKSGLSDREIVELTVAIGAYNGVSRFLVALDVGEKNL